jgi:hypothetical protein
LVSLTYLASALLLLLLVSLWSLWRRSSLSANISPSSSRLTMYSLWLPSSVINRYCFMNTLISSYCYFLTLLHIFLSCNFIYFLYSPLLNTSPINHGCFLTS